MPCHRCGGAIYLDYYDAGRMVEYKCRACARIVGTYRVVRRDGKETHLSLGPPPSPHRQFTREQRRRHGL